MMKCLERIERREFLGLITAGIGAVAAETALGARTGIEEQMLVYVGTYTGGNSTSKGIYIHRFDSKTGRVSPYKIVEGVEEPSFLSIHPNGRYLFAVNETLEYEGMKSGALSSFRIDRKTGDLTFINKVPSLGGAPCHLTVSADGRYVLVANYMGGNVAVFPVDSKGRLGSPSSVRQHTGSGPNKERQEAAHAHSIILDKDDRFAFVNDLGIDRVVIYQFDHKMGKLIPHAKQGSLTTVSGAGPRHFKFHPSGNFAFIVNELNMTVSSLSYDRSTGGLKELFTVSTVPEGFSGENTCADIHVSSDGRFVYASNRGHDSIAVFAFKEVSGRLERIEIVSTGGKTPRNFAIEPNGKFLLAANQNSDSIVTFSRDPVSGRIKNTGEIVETPRPVCVLFHAV